MSAADIASQTGNLIELSNDLVMNPAVIMLLMPQNKPKPYICPQRGALFGELRVETAGKNRHIIYTADYNGAKSLANALLNRINGPNHKPGGKSKLIEIPNSGGTLIYPAHIVAMLIDEKTYISDTGTNQYFPLFIETWAGTTFSVDFTSRGAADKVRHTLQVASNGKAKTIKRNIEQGYTPPALPGRRHEAILARLHTQPTNDVLAQKLNAIASGR
jgi:hypothetical protein